MSALEVYRVLTYKQPFADLIMAGVKDVENRSWPVPSTLPQWGDCPGHGRVILDYPPNGHIADDGPDTEIGMGHAPGCMGECRECPVPVPVQADPRYPCGPIEPDGPFPFRLWIHAGAQVDHVALEPENTDGHWESARIYLDWLGYITTRVDERDGLDASGRLGVLLGSVLVTGCHHADECEYEHGDTAAYSYCSRWAEPDVYHWTLTDPQPLPEPVPMRGRQGLWTLKGDDLALLADAEGVTA